MVKRLQNHSHTIQGQMPGIHLSPEGQQQASRLAITLAYRQFVAIYTSDLERCMETVQPIIATRPETPLHPSDCLREICYGSYEGKPSSSLDWQALPGTNLIRKVADGDSWIDLSKRVVPYLNDEIYKTYGDNEGEVLIVTHGGPMRVIRAALSNIALGGLIPTPIENCEYWDLEMRHPARSISLAFDEVAYGEAPREV